MRAAVISFRFRIPQSTLRIKRGQLLCMMPCSCFIRFVCHYFPVRCFLLNHELRAAIGAGSKRTRATKGATAERPLAKAFAAMLPKSIEGNMNLKNTEAAAETITLTHQGHSTSKLSMDSSLRAIKFDYRITDA